MKPRTFILMWLWSSPLPQPLMSLTLINIPLSGYLYPPWLALMLKILRSTGQRVKGLTGWFLLWCFILENHPAVCSPSNRKHGEVNFPLTQAGVLLQTTGATEHPLFLCKNTAVSQKKPQKKTWSASAIAGNLMHGAWRRPGWALHLLPAGSPSVTFTRKDVFTLSRQHAGRLWGLLAKEWRANTCEWVKQRTSRGHVIPQWAGCQWKRGLFHMAGRRDGSLVKLLRVVELPWAKYPSKTVKCICTYTHTSRASKSRRVLYPKLCHSWAN